jgi:hypothetical protein
MQERELRLVAIVTGSLVGVLLVVACTFYWSQDLFSLGLRVIDG